MGFLDKLFGRKKKKEEAAVEEPVVTEEKKEAEEAEVAEAEKADEPKRETEAPKPEIVPEVPVAPPSLPRRKRPCNRSFPTPTKRLPSRFPKCRRSPTRNPIRESGRLPRPR